MVTAVPLRDGPDGVDMPRIDPFLPNPHPLTGRRHSARPTPCRVPTRNSVRRTTLREGMAGPALPVWAPATGNRFPSRFQPSKGVTR